MELGGNAPFLVLADADVEAAVAGAMAAKMRNGGEACTAANRFFVHASVAEEFATGLASAMAAVRVGPGMEPGVQLGPLINEGAREKIERLVADAVDRGARVRCGGSRIAGPGFFYPPTVLDQVPAESEMLADEVFGPVAPIVAFEDESDAIAAANDTEYGLVAYVYTRDIKRAFRVCEALETGMIGLNQGLVSNPAAPFGGVKQSGFGREGGAEGIHEYLEVKYVALNL
jgi:succinate-semialdehyde dehydrogenase/glutarate-semialdehyde dehydrogenase